MGSTAPPECPRGAALGQAAGWRLVNGRPLRSAPIVRGRTPAGEIDCGRSCRDTRLDTARACFGRALQMQPRQHRLHPAGPNLAAYTVRKIVGTIHVIGIGVAARVILVGETGEALGDFFRRNRHHGG
jgi:hypothetical protein